MQLFIKLLTILFFQIVLSIWCLSRKKKGLSYFLEILVVVCSVVYELYVEKTEIISLNTIYYLFEYIFAKVVILILIIILRYVSFYQVLSITKDGTLSKIGYFLFGKKKFCKIVSNFRKLEYGPRLKLGLPGMVNKIHKKTGIKFDEKGFPKFKSMCTIYLPKKYHKKSREVHFYNASKMLYDLCKKNTSLRKKFNENELKIFSQGGVPEKYTWHHHQNKGVLQLVNRDIHADVNHIGGFSIWGKKK